MKYRYILPQGETYNIFIDNLKQTHLLIAGTTGSGKSVLENNIISTALYFAPCQYEFILIDTKRVELSQYRTLPHTLYYADDAQKAVNALRYAVDLIEKRYKYMQAHRLKKFDGSKVLIVIDELADLMTTNKKQVLPLLQKIGQIARASNVSMIACTQCPLTSVIPTQLKCNFDSIYGLRTRSAQDSRNIINQAGLESLPRYGKAHYITPEHDIILDVPMIDEAEQNFLINHWHDKRNIKKAI